MSMEVRIELGHKAWKNIKPTIEGHTHDWTVFVRGVNDNEIKHIVEKVIFHLPDGYPDPKQIREKPPFVLSDSTSQSFSMSIDVFFCAGAELNKVCYIYDVSISNEEINSSWEERVIFSNPSKDMKEKLLLAGGKMVDTKKTSELNGPFVNCKVMPDDEIIKGMDSAEALVVKKIEDLHELLKENENLKTSNQEVKEKTNLQEKLLSSYVEKLSSCETSISTARMGIKQLQKKIETDEKEISTLKLQVQMLQNELSQIKNPSTKNPEKNMKEKKRKIKENLNLSAPVVKKRGHVIQPAKVTSSPSLDVPSTSQSSLSKDFSVSVKKQNIHESVKGKRSITIVQNSSPSKTDAGVNDSSDTISGNHFSSWSNNEKKLVNVNASLHQTICGVSNHETLNYQRNVSFKSTIACDKRKLVKRRSVEKNHSWNIAERANNNFEKPLEESSIKANPSVIKSNLRNRDGENSTDQVSMEVTGSLDIPEKRNMEVEKPVEGSSIEANSAVIKSEPRNNGCEKSTDQGLMKIASSLDIPEKRNMNVEKPVEGSSIEPNAAVIESELRNSDCEKPTDQGSMKIAFSLDILEIRNNYFAKPVERNSLAANTALNDLKIRKSDVKKPRRIIDTDGLLNETSAEVNASVNESETRNVDEKNAEEISIELTTPLNKFEITTNDDAVKLIGKSSNKSLTATNNDTVKFIEGNSCEGDFAFSKKKLCAEPSPKDLVEQFEPPSKKQHVSSIQITCKNPFLLNCEINGKKLTSFVADENSSLTLNNSDCKNEQNPKSKKGYLPKFRNVFQNKNLNHSTVCRKSSQDMHTNYGSTLIAYMSNHHHELVVELDRIKNSKFGKFRHKTNPLFYKLGNIDSNISDKYFMRYIRSITDFFTNIKSSFDMATIVYLVVDYLSCSTINYTNGPTYIQNQGTNVSMPRSENCIITALCEVERISLPHFNGLIRNTLNIIHRVIVSKKRMAANGLASLCRVFMELCRRRNDRWEPLFLCCELLRLGHPLAPYLINCLAAVWRGPFYMHNEFSVEERILLGSIIYGMKEKPLLMNSNLWDVTCRLTSTYFPHPVIVDSYEALQFLTATIFSRCNEGLFENLWILTSPLSIFVLNKSWDAKIYFRNEYVVPNLLHFARCLNEQAFNFFCNLYVDICSFCHESPFEELLQYFNNTALYEGKTFVQDCAAVAMLKYVITADIHIPAPLSFWLLRNKNNPKLSIIVDLYCKKVMESQDNLLLWDDIIML